jgi:REP element-mobilizing transposase RayT/DNA-binding NarL/FixJ family response regulator
MQKIVLVATPYMQFGELLRLSLEEGEIYRVYIAQTASEAFTLISKVSPDLVIVDNELKDNPVKTIVQNIRKMNPVPKLVLIPPENNPNHPLVNQLQPDGCLSRPFYLPGMLQMVYQLLHPSVEKGSQSKEPSQPQTQLLLENPLNLEDETQLKQHLSQYLKNASSRAAIVTRNGVIFAFSGDITAQDAQTLSDLLSRYWSTSNNYDLVRFVHLDSRDEDALLYATPLDENLGLGLVNAPQDPISQVREEIYRFAKELKNSYTREAEVSKSGFSSPVPPTGLHQTSESRSANTREEKKEDTPYKKLDTLPIDVIRAVEQNMLREMPQEQSYSTQTNNSLSASPELESILFDSWGEMHAANGDPAPSLETAGEMEDDLQPDETPSILDQLAEDDLDELEVPPLPTQEGISTQEFLLDEVVPPVSGDSTASTQEESLYNASNSDAGEKPAASITLDLEPDKIAPEISGSNDSINVVPNPNFQDTYSPLEPAPEEKSDREDNFSIVFPWDENETQPFITGHKAFTRPLFSSDTIPIMPRSGKTSPLRVGNPQGSHTYSGGSYSEAEPLGSDNSEKLLDAQIQNGMYTCLLLTRIPGNRLKGDLGRDLTAWLTEICRTSGWPLDAMAVRPEYLQWTICLPPTVSPASLVKSIRLQTSEKTLNKYPRLKPIDDSDDFWAPGYLIIQGTQPPDQKTLYEFIQLTRRRQGYLSY